MNFPSNLRYSEDHEWIRVDADDYAYVGITDYAQKELDELVYVEVGTVGEYLKKGAQFGTVEAVKVTSELFMPVSGTVLQFNPLVDDDKNGDPTLINRDPYVQGWIIKIKVSEPDELNDLLDAEQYEGSLH